MVYRDLPAEEAQKTFDELTTAPDVKALEPIETRELPKSKRKVVKGLVPKNK